MVTPNVLKGVLERLLHSAERFTSGQIPARWVGLDLGSRSIKLAEMEQTPKGPRLVRVLIQELPVAAEGQAIDRAGWLHSALKEVSERSVHVALEGSRAVVRRVHMPLMPERELHEAVRWQLKEQLPFPAQEAVIDVRVLGQVWEKDIKKQDLVVVAASAPRLCELIETVERSGARVASLTPMPSAAWSCVATLLPDAQRGSVVLIELGAHTTHVAIVKDGQLCVVRDLAIGSESVTDALVGTVLSEQGHVAIDHAKAETLKRQYGVLSEASEGTTNEGVPLFHLASLMRPILEQLLTEISRFLDFYKVQLEQGGVSRVLLCGGGANLKSLQTFLADGLGVPVEVFNPILRIPDQAQRMEPEQIAEQGPRLAVAIGAALEHGRGLDLLPEDIKRARRAVHVRRRWTAAVKGIAAAALVGYLGLQGAAGWLTFRIQQEQRAWKRVEPAYREGMQLASTRDRLAATVHHAQQFLDEQPIWDGILKELGELIPPALQLDQLIIAADAAAAAPTMRFELTGEVASSAAAGGGRVAQFLEALERSPFFEDVVLVSSELRSNSAERSRFHLEGFLE
jgi:type IV pilus assembly protein PilM